MNEQTCCFSGHRHLPKQETLHIHNLLVKHILKLIHIGVNTFFICGEHWVLIHLQHWL